VKQKMTTKVTLLVALTSLAAFLAKFHGFFGLHNGG
jgi:hypothetical protein